MNNELDLILIGKANPSLNPNLIHKLIKEGVPLPIKYTHSLLSLESLFNYSLKINDKILYEWVCEQISLNISKEILQALHDSIPRNLKISFLKKNSYNYLLKNYKNMTENDLNNFRYRTDIPNFFFKQFERISEFNGLNSTLIDKDNINKPLITLNNFMNISFENCNKKNFEKNLNPKKIIEKFNIHPIIYISNLINFYSKTMNWNAILTHELFQKKNLIGKKTLLPINLIIEKLKLLGASNKIINELLEF